MIRFQKKYFLFAIVLFLIEALIANFSTDSFIRPVFGDFLVVILIYCILHSFLDVAAIPLALGVLAFAFTVEGLQYIDISSYIGWENSALRRMTLGNTFDWRDLVAYTLGIGVVLVLEKTF